METASHMSRGQMMKNERGTSTPLLLTQNTVRPWLLDKLHRDSQMHRQPATRAGTHPVLSQTGAWALLTSHHSLKAPEGGEGIEALGRI